MDLILDTYAIRDKDCWRRCCAGANLDEKLWIIRQSGWDGAELWDDDVKTFLETKTLEDLQYAVGRLTLPSYKYMDLYSNCCTGPDPYGMVERAAALGVKSIVCALVQPDYCGGKAPHLYAVVDQYRYLLTIAEKKNITVGLEFISFAPCYNTLKDAVTIVNKVDHPLARVVLDTFHIWKCGDENFNTFERHLAECGLKPEQVSVVHMADAPLVGPVRDAQRDGDRKIPGRGGLNLPRFLRIMENFGYTGPLVLDLYDKSLADIEPRAVSEACFQGMAAQVRNAKCLS